MKKINRWKKPEKRNEKTYIFQLNDYLTYIIPHASAQAAGGIIPYTIPNISYISYIIRYNCLIGISYII